MTWHALLEGEEQKLLTLTASLNIHHLHVEDCQKGGQAAKVEDGEGYLFVVLKPVHPEADGSLLIGDFDLFLGSDWLLTYEETGCSSVRQVVDRVRSASNLDPAHLAYRLMDGIVDSYIPVLDNFSEQIDQIESEVLERPEPDLLQRIFSMKRNLIDMRRILTQTRDVAGHMMRTAGAFLSESLRPYFRDIYDHLSRHIESVEMARDLLSGALDIYLSSVANRTNQAMKVLTLLSTFALPTLVISSFFGMNFEHMPWTKDPTGLLYAGAAAITMTVIIVGSLRWKKWL